jgi:Fe-S-cluster-containing dehydrogenase component
MAKQLGFYFNQDYCVGCESCVTACKVKNKLEIGVRWRKVDTIETNENGREVERWLTHSCMHCAEPACAAKCPVKAFAKRPEDGIVTLNSEICIGCGNCARNCPYNAIAMRGEKYRKASKCDLCLDYQAKGEQPACVRGCPVQILKHGDINNTSPKTTTTALGFKPHRTGPSMRFIRRKEEIL